MSRKHFVGNGVGLTMAALFVSVSLNAGAQIPDESPPPPETAAPLPPEAAPIDEKKIDQFADAYLAIEEIHAEALSELEATEDPESANEVRAAAEGRIIKAVERSGLQLAEFNQIAELMAADVALRARIADRVEKRRRI